jgi:hypothetical protein
MRATEIDEMIGESDEPAEYIKMIVEIMFGPGE